MVGRGLGVGVAVLVGALVGVAVLVDVGNRVSVQVAVAVGVLVRVGVWLGVGVGELSGVTGVLLGTGPFEPSNSTMWTVSSPSPLQDRTTSSVGL